MPGYGPITGQDGDGSRYPVHVDKEGNIHVHHPEGLKSVTMSTPGDAFVNGTDAMCLVVASSATAVVEINSVYITTKEAGDFYLVAKNLSGAVGGVINDETFDLIGIRGDGVSQTSDVIWSFFAAANGKNSTAGNFDIDLPAGEHLYLIAPDITYTIAVSWLED